MQFWIFPLLVIVTQTIAERTSSLHAHFCRMLFGLHSTSVWSQC
uniref:Cycloartenol synthase n=1 Tax=Arundo donax TaxID=35708 RepID=A0A0A8YUC5_ARUDO